VYRVFVSHGAADSWIARQIARCVAEAGAVPFLDEDGIPKGADFKRVIHREISQSQELIALFTPWSAKRSWVWIEIGAAWGQGKPVIAVFQGMGVNDLEDSGQGRAILEDINVLQLNDLEIYMAQLSGRAREQ
jgi:hypothetical protein